MNNGHSNGNGSGEPGNARRIDRGMPDPLNIRTLHPENTCFGCMAVGLAVVLGLIIAGLVYWRTNPEFQLPPSDEPPPAAVAQ